MESARSTIERQIINALARQFDEEVMQVMAKRQTYTLEILAVTSIVYGGEEIHEWAENKRFEVIDAIPGLELLTRNTRSSDVSWFDYEEATGLLTIYRHETGSTRRIPNAIIQYTPAKPEQP